jgi:DNA-binding FrmR family transcriptional regulator
MTAAGVLIRPRAGHAGRCHDAEILSQLGNAKGQLAGIASMYEDERHCIDILDQLAAARAAIDTVAVILLRDHVNSCVQDAIDRDDSDEEIDELISAVRRYLCRR